MKIALVVIAFNRVDSLTRLLASLSSAYYSSDNVPLIISIDKSKTDVVEKYADSFTWCHGEKQVIKHEKNLGLRNHILSQGALFESYDALVILEDDLIVSKSFYYYVEQTVNKYHNDKSIAGISLYSYSTNYETSLPFSPVKDENDVYFINTAMSWGEVWMKEQWQEFYAWYEKHKDFSYSKAIPEQILRWNEKSWLKYHTRYCIESNKFFVFPYVSLTTNFSEKGTHSESISSVYQVTLQEGKKELFVLPNLEESMTKYDGFFENRNIYNVLGLSEAELCIDINGKKGNRMGKHYWLTTLKTDYPLIDSFGLSYRPIEMNVILKQPGDSIYLYKVDDVQQRKIKKNKKHILYYYHLDNIIDIIRSYSLKNTFIDFVSEINRKLKQVFKTR